ncbi:AraC family transcriptional regulator [Bacillus sp. OVS6]|nr:AraC family transcriptional regulator [Bacillus sp. OVS6]
MTVLPRSTMLKAMLSADKTFDGVFYTGVKTTKIYCLPSCYAKKPLPENVIFSNRQPMLKTSSSAHAKNVFLIFCKVNGLIIRVT